MARKSFSVHADYFDELLNLTNEQRGVLLKSLIDWAMDKETKCSDPICAMLFRLMTAQIERISQVNSANGSKGGRPPKTDKSEISEEKRIKPTVTNTVTLSVPDTNTIINADAPTTTTGIGDLQPINKQIKQDKYGNVVLTEDEYNKLLSDFGESTVENYIAVVDEWANNRSKIAKNTNWEKTVRKAIAEQWGNSNTGKKTISCITRTDSEYSKPFIRRTANE